MRASLTPTAKPSNPAFRAETYASQSVLLPRRRSPSRPPRLPGPLRIRNGHPPGLRSFALPVKLCQPQAAGRPGRPATLFTTHPVTAMEIRETTAPPLRLDLPGQLMVYVRGRALSAAAVRGRRARSLPGPLALLRHGRTARDPALDRRGPGSKAPPHPRSFRAQVGARATPPAARARTPP
jgi:hypothetical protein